MLRSGQLHYYDRWSSQLASKLRLQSGRALAAPRSAPPPPHRLTLYEYEASPWCRLVREQLTVLDLRARIRPCPRQTLWAEGAHSLEARFRPEALRRWDGTGAGTSGALTFPLLVDDTKQTHRGVGDTNHSRGAKDESSVVIMESYKIIQYLWKTYGRSVLPTDARHRRPDQRANDGRLPFVARFLSLAAPSYLRPFPRCGLMRTPSSFDSRSSLTLYQTEGCPASRLVREVLCTLELPYLSVPFGEGGSHHHRITAISASDSNACSGDNTNIHDTDLWADAPILLVGGDGSSSRTTTTLIGAEECCDFLWKRHTAEDGVSGSKKPSWLDPAPSPNMGRNGSFSVGAYAAVLRGAEHFVPPETMR